LINDPYTALNYILQSNTAITSLLGFFTNPATGLPTTIPLIQGGVLAEQETALPCIVFYNDNHTEDFNLSDSNFTVNCYAKTERDSFLLARTVVKELKGNQNIALGYPVTITARILATIPNPIAKEVNTAVEIRLFNIGGAL